MAEVARHQEEGATRARRIFERGYADLKGRGLKEERVVLLEAWKALETAVADEEALAKVEKMMPRVVKKRRKVDEDGSMEECAWSLGRGSAIVLLTLRAQTSTCSSPTTRRSATRRRSSCCA
jgi:hypothetical protein